jgi:hypothetical protein
MKRSYFLIVLLFVISTIVHGLIWSEGFSGYPNHTGLVNIGGVPTPTGAYPLADGKWTLDVTGAPNFDYFYTIDGVNDVLRIEETGVGGEVVFRTEVIDISDYFMISCQVNYQLSEYVSTVGNGDYIRTYYILDGAAEQMFVSGNGEILGEVTNFNYYAVQNNLCGNTLQIVIRMSCDANGDLYEINRITVDGCFTEPTNHVTNFAVEEDEFDAIVVSWNSAGGDTHPDGYLIKASTGVIIEPVDGENPVEDLDLTDGVGQIIRESNSPDGVYANSFYSYSGSTTYNFKIYPFTNNASTCHPIDYKTDGIVPAASLFTEPEPSMPEFGDIIINEIFGNNVTPGMPLDGYIELYNTTPLEMYLSNLEIRYYDNGSPVPTATLTLHGHVNPHEYIVICQDFSMFSMTHLGAPAHFQAPRVGFTSLFPLDGGADTIELYLNDAKAGVIDRFNNPNAPWEWDGAGIFGRISLADGGSEENWGAGDGIPGGDDSPLPIVLSYFSAFFSNESLFLKWRTESEFNNAGWNVYRAVTSVYSQALKMNENLIEGAGTTYEATDYSYIDKAEYSSGNLYFYWIESLDYANSTDLFGPVSVEIPEQDNPEAPEVPEFYGLAQNYPNPFNPSTEIMFKLQNSGTVKVSVYNVKGEKVATLFDEFVQNDIVNKIVWNGMSDSNKQAASGVYYYKLESKERTEIKKMLLIK